jgi:hypothetical protein
VNLGRLQRVLKLFEIKLVNQQAALYAVKNWHYSKSLPASKLIRYGIFEDNKFIGVIIFSRGASPHLGNFLNLDQTEICELTRIALDKHVTPVSQLVASCLKLLKQSSPGLRCIVSFADPKEGHKGGVYQAGNWFYTGKSNPVVEYYIDSRWRHKKSVYDHPQRPYAPNRTMPGKFRYLYPLDKNLRRKLAKLSLQYPNAVEGLKVSHSNSVTKVQVQPLPTALENI